MVLSSQITNPWKIFELNKPKGCSTSGKSKLLSDLHIWVIKEYSSRAVVSDMDLYYEQYKHILETEILAWE